MIFMGTINLVNPDDIHDIHQMIYVDMHDIHNIKSQRISLGDSRCQSLFSL